MNNGLAILSASILLSALMPISEARAHRVLLQEWVSPDHRTTISSLRAQVWKEPGYDLWLHHLGHKPVVIDEYYRSVDVAWSPDSEYVAVTDWIGSNVADCYLVDVAKPESVFSVTSAVPSLPESPDNSHFYVSCKNWEGSRKIKVEVSGHTDESDSHEFDYRFVFDVNTHRMRRL